MMIGDSSGLPIFFGMAMYCFQSIGLVLPMEVQMKNPRQAPLIFSIGMTTVRHLSSAAAGCPCVSLLLLLRDAGGTPILIFCWGRLDVCGCAVATPAACHLLALHSVPLAVGCLWLWALVIGAS